MTRAYTASPITSCPTKATFPKPMTIIIIVIIVIIIPEGGVVAIIIIKV